MELCHATVPQDVYIYMFPPRECISHTLSMFRVTHQADSNLPSTSTQKFRFSMRRMYQDATFVLVSTGGLCQRDVSPCTNMWDCLFELNFCIIQGSTTRRALGLVNFVPALAYHFCLNLPAALSQPGARLLVEPCTWHDLRHGEYTSTKGEREEGRREGRKEGESRPHATPL